MNEQEYVLMTWPESYILIDQVWFNECKKTKKMTDIGYWDYYVPINRYKELIPMEVFN